MKKFYIIIILSFISSTTLLSQKLHVDVNNLALNEVIILLRDNYSINVSFNDKNLSNYIVTLNQQFSSPDEAFKYLLKDIPIDFIKKGEVYLFFSNEKVKKRDFFILGGKILDSETFESLPFTHLLINNYGAVTDEYGNFNYKSNSDSTFQLRISHLGYEILDTTISYGNNHQLTLKYLITNIKEIIVKGSNSIFINEDWNNTNGLHLNHRVVKILPGNGDNSIFNLLRLQPGILASGEQSKELIIWGNYPGQSEVNFDGITVFGLKNYNDNISTVNPFMAKDIRIYKGGFDATMGDRVGSIIDITGIEGNNLNSQFYFNINNMTLNLMAKAPIGSNNTIIGAFRQTYYNLYTPEDFISNREGNSHMGDNSVSVIPNYIFQDLNFKFSGHSKNQDTYFISTFVGQDKYNYTVDNTNSVMNISQKLNENNKQFGINGSYHKLWKGTGNSDLNIAFSGLQSEIFDKQSSSQMHMNQNMHNTDKHIINAISRLQIKLSNTLTLNPRHELSFGNSFINVSSNIKEDLSSILIIDESNETKQIMTYIQDKISLSSSSKLTIGIRGNYEINQDKFFIQPRFKINLSPLKNLHFNFTYGLYNQFMVLNTLIDENNNYSFQWQASDGIKIPVLSANHYVFQTQYLINGFTFNLESYFKEINGITRIISNNNFRTYYIGKGKTIGSDLLVKKTYKNHTGWISYTLSQSLEWFPFFEDNEYQKALHDQKHEIKLSYIINLSPFTFSINHVFGSGFTEPINITGSTEYGFPYNRTDIAGIYQFAIGNIKTEAGISILNLFNIENIKYSNIVRIPTDDNNTFNIYSEAVPFTPTIFLNISF